MVEEWSTSGFEPPDLPTTNYRPVPPLQELTRIVAKDFKRISPVRKSVLAMLIVLALDEMRLNAYVPNSIHRSQVVRKPPSYLHWMGRSGIEM